jgi:tight adherence protein C
MLVTLISLLVGLSILLLLGGLVAIRTDTTVSERFSAYLAGSATEKVTLQELELSQPFFDRAILPLIKQIARMFAWMWPANRLDALRRRLVMAGNPSGLSATDFVGVKGLVMALVTGLGILFGWLTGYKLDYYSGLLLVALALCSFFLPDVWLSRQIRQRQAGLVAALPDALDMLTIAVEAGLSFENAIQEIVAKWDNTLSLEFARVLRDLAMGKARSTALRDLGERTGVPDIISFVTSMNQAEELGVSIGRMLTVQAEELRVRRRQRAQELANQAPIKMLFPIVFLIFPAIFAVLLGPAVPQLLTAFSRT